MPLDAFKNFAKGTLSTGYDGSATSIVLTTGHGAKFPAVPFNATWWNSTDYPDPSDDPNVEIVRVTGISSDTFTITRAQDGTSASTKNIGGKTYKLSAGLTAKTLNTDFGFAYAIPFSHGSTNPTGTNSYLFGGIPNAGASANTGGNRRVNFTENRTIGGADFVWLASGTAGSGESISMYVRINNTTDYLIASVANTNAQKLFQNLALSIAVGPGDYAEIKYTMGGQSTPSTSVFVGGNLFMKS